MTGLFSVRNKWLFEVEMNTEEKKVTETKVSWEQYKSAKVENCIEWSSARRINEKTMQAAWELSYQAHDQHLARSSHTTFVVPYIHTYIHT